MQVETFEVEEMPGGTTPEIEAEAVQLIETLGLTGQKELLVPKADATAERIQFPEMTAQEQAVYRELFPQQTEVENYSAALIPLRVLQLISYVKEQEHFLGLQVWHKKMRDPDPILVGRRKGDKLYLIARWGDALKQFKDLIEEARAAAVLRIRRIATQEIAELQPVLAAGGAENIADRLIGGERWIKVGAHYL